MPEIVAKFFTAKSLLNISKIHVFLSGGSPRLLMAMPRFRSANGMTMESAVSFKAMPHSETTLELSYRIESLIPYPAPVSAPRRPLESHLRTVSFHSPPHCPWKQPSKRAKTKRFPKIGPRIYFPKTVIHSAEMQQLIASLRLQYCFLSSTHRDGLSDWPEANIMNMVSEAGAEAFCSLPPRATALKLAQVAF
jgi:hypothetical protein